MKIGRIVFKKSVVQKLGKKIIKGKKEQSINNKGFRWKRETLISILYDLIQFFLYTNY